MPREKPHKKSYKTPLREHSTGSAKLCETVNSTAVRDGKGPLLVSCEHKDTLALARIRY